jgi:hypothetical protein
MQKPIALEATAKASLRFARWWKMDPRRALLDGCPGFGVSLASDL